MGKIVAEQAEKGLLPFVRILIAISVALGLFNLLPFPALDGGRLVFLGYEVVTRRRPNERIEAAVHAIGLLFLLSVIVLVTFRDVIG
jgi:regulator of sigma E protease